MKNYNHKESEEYEKARRIAIRISNVMQSKEKDFDREITDWLSDENSQETIHRLSDEETFTELCGTFDREERHNQSRQLANTLKNRQSKIGRIRLIRTFSTTIAAALVIASFLIWNNVPEEKPKQKIAVISTGVIKHNPEKPTLILGNGTNIDLTATAKINLLKNEKRESKVDTVEYNTVIIPKQFTFNVTLSDGTIVHLNANSELKYPTKFIAAKREVFLKGEAFFEVQKGSKPFIVTTSGMNVKVYGTKFNINAHNSDNIQTVLIEGSVSVKQQCDSAETFIKPNQLVTLNNKGEIDVRDVDADRYIAWMNGFIRGDEESMANLLDNIAKWYGVEFLYTEDIKTIKVSASLNRQRPLEEIIEALEVISGVKIVKKEGEKYMVL